MSQGKGDTPRPLGTPREEFEARWEDTFGKGSKSESGTGVRGKYYKYQCKDCSESYGMMKEICEESDTSEEACPKCSMMNLPTLTSSPSHGEGPFFGRTAVRPPEGFKEVLRKIHNSNPGSILKDSSSHI